MIQLRMDIKKIHANVALMYDKFNGNVLLIIH